MTDATFCCPSCGTVRLRVRRTTVVLTPGGVAVECPSCRAPHFLPIRDLATRDLLWRRGAGIATSDRLDGADGVRRMPLTDDDIDWWAIEADQTDDLVRVLQREMAR